MAAATLPLPHADSTAADPAVNFTQACFAFRQLETWLTSDEATTASEAQVEEQLEQRGRELLRLLLRACLRQRGTGQVGPALQVFEPPAATDASAAALPSDASQDRKGFIVSTPLACDEDLVRLLPLPLARLYRRAQSGHGENLQVSRCLRRAWQQGSTTSRKSGTFLGGKGVGLGPGLKDAPGTSP